MQSSLTEIQDESKAYAWVCEATSTRKYGVLYYPPPPENSYLQDKTFLRGNELHSYLST